MCCLFTYCALIKSAKTNIEEESYDWCVEEESNDWCVEEESYDWCVEEESNDWCTICRITRYTKAELLLNMCAIMCMHQIFTKSGIVGISGINHPCMLILS